ncbi:MAG: T9SS type A sorting domain-containing protein [Ignavibacteriae bacterium]|nr:T9SS type A sorting domain-containing protein [Ignavibacteriota bacterium]MCB9242215.1 T9SS type A sorting domain-containing protein [Ignavibacteriales bacterium]
MKRVPTLLSLLVMVSIIFCGTAFSQTETGSWQNQTDWTGNNTQVSGELTTMSPQRTVTAQELAIENRILEIKRTGNGTKQEVIQLQKQLDNINGINATVQTSPIPGAVVEAPRDNQPPFQQDLGRTEIINTGTNLVSGMVTFTEQNSNNAGRLWACIAFRTTGNPDSLRLYSSTDNGIHWSLRALASLGGTNRINYDQMDMEVVANGDSAFVWVTFGYRVNANGDWLCGGMIIRPTPFGGTVFSMNWPGTSANNRYYRPRLTSDNAQYGTNAYLYIIASYDSVTSAPNRRNSQKYARVLDPYVTSAPTFSYYGPGFYWSTSPSDGNQRDLHSDIAYFRNGSDSIIVSYSNMRDSTKIFFAKCSIGAPVPQTAGGPIGGSEPTLHKQYANLSTNSSGNGSVVCLFRQFVSGSLWGVKYFRTTNYGNFNNITGESILLPRGSISNAFAPFIVGVRNGDAHYFCLRVDSSPDSLAYTRLNGLTGAWDPDNINMNQGGLTTLSGTVFPQPGFRYASGDSCFAIYPDTGPYDMYAGTGCSGSVTSVHNNQIPVKYSLSQNYPNPFNPSTSIRFEIPKDGLVKLVVYDVLGKEVATLINDKRTAGTYLVDFNATGLSSGVYFYKLITSDFTDVKKMTLIK